LLGSKDFLSKGLNNNIGGTPPPLRAQDIAFKHQGNVFAP